EREERRGLQQFVGERIEQRPGSRGLVQPSREVAVEVVGDRRDEKDAKAEEVGEFSEEDDDEKRHQKNAEQGQRVRQVPDLVAHALARGRYAARSIEEGSGHS